MTEQILIRKETSKDYIQVFNINQNAFKQDAEAKLVNALRNNSIVFIPQLSLVATISNTIVGHILFTKIKIKDVHGKLNESLALAPMAVLPEFQKKGIGAMLITEGLKTATELGYKSIIVLGHKHYYSKFGFEPARKWDITAPFKLKDEENFRAVELVKDGLKEVSGTVIYPKEFEMV